MIQCQEISTSGFVYGITSTDPIRDGSLEPFRNNRKGSRLQAACSSLLDVKQQLGLEPPAMTGFKSWSRWVTSVAEVNQTRVR